MLIALGCNSDSYVQNGEHFSAVEDYAKLSTAPGIAITVIPAGARSA
jgi:hypothetical protein